MKKTIFIYLAGLLVYLGLITLFDTKFEYSNQISVVFFVISLVVIEILRRIFNRNK